VETDTVDVGVVPVPVKVTVTAAIVPVTTFVVMVKPAVASVKLCPTTRAGSLQSVAIVAPLAGVKSISELLLPFATFPV
jgi:hypothetical protein